MATNEILLFAHDPAANVQTQAEYLADAQREIGHQPGIAKAELENKALRQTSLVAAAVAQLIADKQASDVVDTLTAPALAAMLESAIKATVTPPAQIVITATGLTVFNKDPDAVSYDVELWGGSGAGGGGGGANFSNGGGGGGGYSKKRILQAAMGATENVTVGAGGPVGGSGAGSPGGTTSFGAHFSATGGNGGDTNSSTVGQSNGGVGGIGVGGDINLQGQPGSPNISSAGGGNGGAMAMGGGGARGVFNAGNGLSAATRRGGGGAGGGSNSTPNLGGAGGNGECIITINYS